MSFSTMGIRSVRDAQGPLEVLGGEDGGLERLVGYECFGGDDLVCERVRVVVPEPLLDPGALERGSVGGDDWVLHDFEGYRAEEVLEVRSDVYFLRRGGERERTRRGGRRERRI